jgi:biofilm PGA synthesis N-glycosyltransferase PgaC
MYRTRALAEVGGWSTRTLAEDMDLTWTLYHRGYAVRFVPESTCYPIEPNNFLFLSRQLRRWSHGLVQNVQLHWRELLEIPFLRNAVAVSFWDAVIASVVYLIILPVAALALRSPYPLLGYVIDVPAVLVPVAFGAWKRGDLGRAIASIPDFFLLRTVNAVFFLAAVWSEMVRGRRLTAYEKGH